MHLQISERDLKSKLTVAKYTSWLQENFANVASSEHWNPNTGSCGAHVQWVIETLGIQQKNFAESTIIQLTDVSAVLDKLDKGHLLVFLHDYRDRLIGYRLRKNNRYGNHTFILLKAGDKYIMTQGFLHAYKHSLITYKREEIEQMLSDIITRLSDYENKKVWRDLDLLLYKKYFRTDLFMYPRLPVKLDAKVHNVVLRMDVF